MNPREHILVVEDIDGTREFIASSWRQPATVCPVPAMAGRAPIICMRGSGPLSSSST